MFVTTKVPIQAKNQMQQWKTKDWIFIIPHKLDCDSMGSLSVVASFKFFYLWLCTEKNCSWFNLQSNFIRNEQALQWSWLLSRCQGILYADPGQQAGAWKCTYLWRSRLYMLLLYFCCPHVQVRSLRLLMCSIYQQSSTDFRGTSSHCHHFDFLNFLF